MSAHLAPRPSRRTFLKLGVVAAAAVAGLRLPDLAPLTSGATGLKVRSALPVPGYEFLPFPEQLAQRPLDPVDVALVPAYVAAQLIQAARLQLLQGPLGRPHDPEGRYTVPFAFRVAALRFPSEQAAPKAAAWADWWPAAGGAVWPAFGRLIIGSALLRRGYSPNDSHPGHLALAGSDLEQRQPRIGPAGTTRFQEWQRTEKPSALALADPSEVGQPNGLRLPSEGTMLIEYDWVIMAGPAQARAARQFIDGLGATAESLPTELPVRLIPLMPLPQAAQAQHAEIWASLAARQTASVI